MITPETETAYSIKMLLWQTYAVNNNFKTAMVMGVDVTGNTLMTMSAQLQPDSYVMMMKL